MTVAPPTPLINPAVVQGRAANRRTRKNTDKNTNNNINPDELGNNYKDKDKEDDGLPQLGCMFLFIGSPSHMSPRQFSTYSRRSKPRAAVRRFVEV